MSENIFECLCGLCMCECMSVCMYVWVCMGMLNCTCAYEYYFVNLLNNQNKKVLQVPSLHG